MQCVHPNVACGKVDEVLDTFDLNCSRVSVKYDGKVWHIRRDSSINTRCISVYPKSIRHPIKTAFRVAKYGRKLPDWNLPMDEYRKIFDMWAELPLEQQKDYLQDISEIYDIL